MNPFEYGASDIATGVNDGSLKVQDVISFYLKRTDTYHSKLNSHIHWDSDRAREACELQIRYIESQLNQGKNLPLAGVPIAIKDNICFKGFATTAGSKSLSDYESPYNAEVIDRLLKAGAVILGKTNLDEFGMGGSNENSKFGPVKNPWNPDCVPGGSSGGSAAAVAADLVPVALGSDTGGSVRQPASFCGLVGLKPSWGRVSRRGLVAFGSSLDQVGVIGRSVLDVAKIFETIAGYDPRDSTSVDSPVENLDLKDCSDYSGKKIAYIKEFLDESAGIQPEVVVAFESFLDRCKELGAEIKAISLPIANVLVPTYYILATAEASSNLSRYDGVRYGYRSRDEITLDSLYSESRSQGFGREVKKRIMLGAYALSSGYYDAWYLKADRTRELIRKEINSHLKDVDYIATPTAPTTAYKIGAKNEDPLSMYLGDIYTVAASLSGHPAISLPCGLDNSGMPIGVQLISDNFEEEKLLKGAKVYEQSNQPVDYPNL